MHVISKRAFNDLEITHPKDQAALQETFKLFRDLNFHTPSEMKSIFCSIEPFNFTHNCWVLNVNGTNLKLITYIHFSNKKMYIKHIVNNADYQKLTQKHPNQKTEFNVMKNTDLIAAYQSFMAVASSFLNISSEEDYKMALDTLEHIFESAKNNNNDFFNPLIEMLNHAIEKYELQDKGMIEFIAGSEKLPIDITLIRTLMNQHKLTGSDLPEIGGKTMVSKVLKGDRALTRSAIERLSVRFGIQPSMFFYDRRKNRVEDAPSF